jgi:hypothetical protein
LPAAGETANGAVPRMTKRWQLGLGGLYTFDFASRAIKPAYGSDPQEAMICSRIVAD